MNATTIPASSRKHLVYQKLPSPNPLLERREQAVRAQRLAKKISDVQRRPKGSSLGNDEPPTFPHLKRNLKKEQVIRDTVEEVEKANKRILARMKGATSSFDAAFFKVAPHQESLNILRRREEVRRVNEENFRMLARLSQKLERGSMEAEMSAPATLNMGSVKHPHSRKKKPKTGSSSASALLAVKPVPKMSSTPAKRRGGAVVFGQAGGYDLAARLTSSSSVLRSRGGGGVGTGAVGAPPGSAASSVRDVLSVTSQSAPPAAPSGHSTRRRKKRKGKGRKRKGVAKPAWTEHPYAQPKEALSTMHGGQYVAPPVLPQSATPPRPRRRPNSRHAPLPPVSPINVQHKAKEGTAQGVSPRLVQPEEKKQKEEDQASAQHAASKSESHSQSDSASDKDSDDKSSHSDKDSDSDSDSDSDKENHTAAVEAKKVDDAIDSSHTDDDDDDDDYANDSDGPKSAGGSDDDDEDGYNTADFTSPGATTDACDDDDFASPTLSPQSPPQPQPTESVPPSTVFSSTPLVAAVVLNMEHRALSSQSTSPMSRVWLAALDPPPQTSELAQYIARDARPFTPPTVVSSRAGCKVGSDFYFVRASVVRSGTAGVWEGGASDGANHVTVVSLTRRDDGVVGVLVLPPTDVPDPSNALSSTIRRLHAGSDGPLGLSFS